MLAFCSTIHEAEAKYESFKSKDPFPQISPAVLNSADIQDYVAATGMLYPFHSESVKASSYRIAILGKYVYWTRDSERIVDTLNEGSRFKLESNSIAFVSVEPLIQLPDYIVARFNLTVNNVYRGLLLGTGPMIDPGFVGRLSIPLHNFTPNDYIFIGGEHLISMEFTKVNPNSRWADLIGTPSSTYIPYPFEEKRRWDVENYLHDADPHRPIMSSIPMTFRNAEKAADGAGEATKAASEAAKQATDAANRASEYAHSVSTRANYTALISVAAIFISLVIIVTNIVNIKNQTLNFVRDAQDKQTRLYDKVYGDYQSNQLDRAKLMSLEKKTDSLTLAIRRLGTKFNR